MLEQSPLERVSHFKEFKLPSSDTAIQKEAKRCMDCGVPFCQTHQTQSHGCPLDNRIPDWNDHVAGGRWKEALELLHSTNNFPEFTGKLCPAPCESACVAGLHGKPVAIRDIESTIVENGFEEGWIKPQFCAPRDSALRQRVAVIGSGPTGLACAQQLVRMGHEVHIFEREKKAGGLLRYGIPDFKLEKRWVDRRIEQLIGEGVVFHLGANLGAGAAQLLDEFDSVALAIGAEAPREVPIGGRNLLGIFSAMDYLRASNRAQEIGQALKQTAPTFSAFQKRVLILGGGDTGSDCLATVVREGCTSVLQFDRAPAPPKTRSVSTPWPLWPLQLRETHAHEEAHFFDPKFKRGWSLGIQEFTGSEGQVTGANVVELDWGCSPPLPRPETLRHIEADLILLATGFTGISRGGLVDSLGIALTSQGTIWTSKNYETSRAGVFAAGDARRGASLIVWAIAEGRKMAEAIARPKIC